MPQAIAKRGDRAPHWVSSRVEYQRCLYRVRFYLWSVSKGFADCTLRDPVTGLELAKHRAENVELARMVSLGLARHFLGKCVDLRHFYAGRLP